MPKMQCMTPEQAIHHFGSKAKLASVLGTSLPTIYDWIAAGEIPEGRQYQIELASGGVLKADKPALRLEAA
jgi:DNA-binding transcriptional regulator YdaS (Cro superfamily)